MKRISIRVFLHTKVTSHRMIWLLLGSFRTDQRWVLGLDILKFRCYTKAKHRSGYSCNRSLASDECAKSTRAIKRLELLVSLSFRLKFYVAYDLYKNGSCTGNEVLKTRKLYVNFCTNESMPQFLNLEYAWRCQGTRVYLSALPQHIIMMKTQYF